MLTVCGLYTSPWPSDKFPKRVATSWHSTSELRALLFLATLSSSLRTQTLLSTPRSFLLPSAAPAHSIIPPSSCSRCKCPRNHPSHPALVLHVQSPRGRTANLDERILSVDLLGLLHAPYAAVTLVWNVGWWACAALGSAVLGLGSRSDGEQDIASQHGLEASRLLHRGFCGCAY